MPGKKPQRISFWIIELIIAFWAMAWAGIGHPCLGQVPKPGTTAGSDSLVFAVTGDIMVHGGQLNSAWNADSLRYEFDPVFEEVAGLLSNADFTLGNFETTLPGDPKLYSGYPAFGSPDEIVSALRRAGFDILTCANNHALDKGSAGALRTIRTLTDNGLFCVGTSALADTSVFDTTRTLVVRTRDFTLAFLGYTYGTNGIPDPSGIRIHRIDSLAMASDIAAARRFRPDFLIVFMHSGNEYERMPNEEQKRLADFLFREGVDVVLGSHPHVLQHFGMRRTTDKYGVTRDRLVIYSLGNFVSNQRKRYSDGGIVFRFTLKKNQFQRRSISGVNYDPVWVWVDRTGPRPQFRILPVLEVLKGNSPYSLPYDDMNTLREFYEDTKVHLRTAW